MIVSFIASFLTAMTGGALLTTLLCPSLKNGRGHLAVCLFAGGGIGIGLASCLYFLCLLAGRTRYIPLVDLGVCLILGVSCFLLSRRKAGRDDRPPFEARRRTRFHLLLAGIFAFELLASVASFIFALLKAPHGRWDAWLIWNMHARFLFRGGEHWRDAFASGLDWSHWDYPLLLPLSVARGWQYIGGETLAVPAAMAFVFVFFTLGLLGCGVSVFRGRTQGYLAAMILMGTPFFIAMGASQFADIPLAFFILTTLVLLFREASSEEETSGGLILAGIAAGLCAWTKNEGLLFFPVVTAVLFGVTLRTKGRRLAFKRVAGFLAGALPILAFVLYFKLRLAPTNDLVAGFNPALLSDKLFDWHRYAEIARAFVVTGISFTQGLVDLRVGMTLNPGAVNILLLIAYLLLAGIRIERQERPAVLQMAAILVLMLAGYFFVYVTTPLDLTYHLITSLNRLFLQLWPSVIFVFFMTAQTPEEASATGPGPFAHPRPPEQKSIPSPLPGRKRRSRR